MSSPNRSFVQQVKFDLVINRMPDVSFDVQAANIPGLTLGAAMVPTPFVKVPYPGEHLAFGDLMVKFKVNETFSNWYEIFKWMTGLGFDKSFKQYRDVKEAKDLNLQGLPIVPQKQVESMRKIGNIFSQITLTVLTGHNNPFISFDFVDAFPVQLSPIDFRTTDSDAEYVNCSVFFKYTSYTARLP